MINSIIVEAKKLLNEKVIATLKERGPRVAITNLYVLLPSPVRMFVKEETFVNFCLANQDKIFGKNNLTTSKKNSSKKASPKEISNKKLVKKLEAKKTNKKK